MKKIFTLLLAVLLGSVAMQAQEAGYQPLVREGVVWHYSRVYEDMPNEDYCTMFFDGDSIINNVVYKKCIEVSANGNRRVAALMREQDKIVYSIGGSTMAEEREGVYEGEIILYDFQNPSNMFPSSNLDDFVLMQTTVEVGGVSCDSYAYDNFNKMIESVGLDGSGTLTEHVFAVLSSTHYQYTGLSYVEKDGKVIYRGRAYDETTSYQPLVREGVVWHYEYYLFDDYYGGSAVDYKVQFRGDTLLNGITYKKCFFYREDALPEHAVPVCFARQVNGQILFTEPNYDILKDASKELVLDLGRLPGQFFETNKEFLVYDFNDMQGFVSKLNQQFPNENYQITSNDDVMLNGELVKSYHLTSATCSGDYIEGIGVDGTNTGYMFAPIAAFPTCYCPMVKGLIKVTTLEGQLLYKGANYEEFYTLSALDHLTHRGGLFCVSQRADELQITVPADGMLSVIDMAGHVVISRVVTQGATEVSTASLAAGVYLVQLSTPAGIQTAKVVVK